MNLTLKLNLPMKDAVPLKVYSFWNFTIIAAKKIFFYYLARKSKLKKIVIPIMVFVLLKAMTLIPLALGVLGLKAFNALQLSFFSFIVSIALAIFQLCKKVIK